MRVHPAGEDLVEFDPVGYAQRVRCEPLVGCKVGAAHGLEKSLGNLNRPLSDCQLADKFRAQATRVLPAAQVDQALDLCWRIGSLSDVRELVTAAVPR